MLKMIARRRAQAFAQSRIMRRAEAVREPLLRNAERGYALPDTHHFEAKGPAGKHRILVATPPATPPSSGFPVLFIVDADAIFGTAVDAVRLQMPWPSVSDVTPFMIVGIGYPGDMPFNHGRRSWDLAPPLRNPAWRSPLGLPWHKPGGADDLIDFLTGPLIDALGARYPIDRSRRGICGLSLGGTFALYALATRPGAFAFHAAVSSALWFDECRVLDDLKAAPRGGHGRASAFIAVGDREIPGKTDISKMMVDGSRSAADELKRIGLPTVYAECAGENHQSTIITTMPRIMREAARRM